MKKYIAELVGTFALVFCGTGAIIIDQATNGGVSHVGIAITFGLIIMAMIYALGDVSGAHMNPAVTIAFTIAGRFKLKEVIPFVVSQVIGAMIATGTLRYLFPSSELLGTTLPAGSEMQSFILEFIMTFFLMLVIINVATCSKEQGMFAGIAIGGTITLDALFGGQITGAGLNPARSFAPALISGHMEHLWLYIVAPIAGAAFAIPVFQIIHGKER